MTIFARVFRFGPLGQRATVSPEELERAIGIIEDLFIVDGVPPHVFIQCGVSPGTLYHAFNHLGLKFPDDLW
jgi:hypothetical protein